MTVSFTLGLKGKTGLTHGPGARIVEGEIKGGAGVTAMNITPKDLELRTIYSLFASSSNAGTYFIPKVGTFTPGDYAANYASVTAYGTGGAPVNLGTFRVFAIGE